MLRELEDRPLEKNKRARIDAEIKRRAIKRLTVEGIRLYEALFAVSTGTVSFVNNLTNTTEQLMPEEVHL